MKYRHSAVIAAVLAVGIGVTSAISAGMWSTLPQVGEPSFCASTVTGIALPSTQGQFGVVPGSTQGTGSSICGQTIPAGPTGLTGTEIVPADTQLASGQSPQTVTVPIILLDSGAYQYTNAVGTNFSAPSQTNALIIDSSGTISSFNVTLPASPINGQQFHLASSASITTLLVGGPSGVTVSQKPTVLTVTNSGSYGYTWIYDATTSTWYRYQ